MIGKFIASRFSGYIALAGAVAIIALVGYIYNEGKSACVNSVNSAQLDSNIEAVKDAQDVKKQEQRLATPELDKALCELEIARGGRGCV